MVVGGESEGVERGGLCIVCIGKGGQQEENKAD
jgi:hypothetical protein